MKEKRPINLNLLTISFPLPAIVSILHRISGVILFLLVPGIVWLLATSLTPEGFDWLQSWLQMPLIKLILFLLLIPCSFHFVAGIRHLLMDVQIGVTKPGGRISSILTFAFSLLLILILGVWIW